MASKDLETAVKAAQLYGGCEGRVSARDAQKLYTRMTKAIARVAAKREMSVVSASEQITAEARRRGFICPLPGKDV